MQLIKGLMEPKGCSSQRFAKEFYIKIETILAVPYLSMFESTQSRHLLVQFFCKNSFKILRKL